MSFQSIRCGSKSLSYFLSRCPTSQVRTRNYRNGDAGDLGKLSATVFMKTSLGMTFDVTNDEGTRRLGTLGQCTRTVQREGFRAWLKRTVHKNITKNMTTWIMALVPGDADEATTETASTWAIGRESRVSSGCGTC